MTGTIKEGWNAYGLFKDCPSRISDIAEKYLLPRHKKLTQHLPKNKLF